MFCFAVATSVLFYFIKKKILREMSGPIKLQIVKRVAKDNYTLKTLAS